MAKRRVGLEPERPEAVLPDRALYLQTFSHLLIVNELLSLSLSLSLFVMRLPRVIAGAPISTASRSLAGGRIPITSLHSSRSCMHL